MASKDKSAKAFLSTGDENKRLVNGSSNSSTPIQEIEVSSLQVHTTEVKSHLTAHAIQEKYDPRSPTSGSPAVSKTKVERVVEAAMHRFREGTPEAATAARRVLKDFCEGEISAVQAELEQLRQYQAQTASVEEAVAACNEEHRKELQKLRQEHAAHTEELLERLRAGALEIETGQSEIEKYSKELDETRDASAGAMAHWERENQELTKQVETMKMFGKAEDVKKLEDAIRVLREQQPEIESKAREEARGEMSEIVKKITEEHAQKVRALQDLHDRLASTETEKDSLAFQLATSKAKVAELQKSQSLVEGLQNHVNKTTKQYQEQLDKESEKSKSALQALENCLKRSEKDRDEARAQSLERGKSVDYWKKQYVSVEKESLQKLEQCEKGRASLRQQLEQLKSANFHLQSSKIQMQDESREKEGENEKLNKINQTIRDELETCMQENERLNQINQTIRDELENCMHACNGMEFNVV